MTWSAQFWLRSAGFPCDWVEDLGVDACRPLLDSRLTLDLEIRRLDEAVSAAFASHPGGLPARMGRALDGGADIAATSLPEALIPRFGPILEHRSELLAQRAEIREQLRAGFAADLSRIRRRLVECLNDPLVQEALFLSNPEALERIRSLDGRDLDQLNARARQHLRMGWNYLQRFCTKNDTASFFGPIAWGRLRPDSPEPLLVRHGDGPWLADRKVFLEHWVIRRIAMAAAADPALAPMLPYRLSPSCDIIGDELRFPVNRSTTLSPGVAALLRDLADAGPAGISAAEVMRRLPAGDGREALLGALELFVSKGVVLRDFVVPAGQEHPEAVLAAQLDVLPSANVWRELLATLSRLREAFAGAGLDGRMAISREIVALLHAHGIDTGRTAGAMYVGRYTLYEDCARAVSVDIGGTVAAEIDRGLGTLLTLHRWTAAAVAAALDRHYREIWRGLGGGVVDFLAFVTEAQRHDAVGAAVDAVRPVLAAAWDALLNGRKGDEIVLTDADLAELLGDLEASGLHNDAPPSLGIDVHSPDFLLAAASPEAVAAGDWRIVLGEVHPGVHTVSQPVAQPFCPNRVDLAREVAGVLAPGRIVLADSPETYQRSNIDWLDIEGLTQVVLPGSASRCPAERQIPAGRGRVADTPDGLRFLDRASGRTDDLVTVMPGSFHRALFALAGDILGGHRSARMVFRHVVVKRRSWKADTAAMPLAGLAAEDVEAFVAWRLWAQRLDLPQFIFAKSPNEPKPSFVDLDNPISVDMLSKIAKSCNTISLSEMSPDFDSLWLNDARGRFCAEFRTSFTFGRGACVVKE